MFRVRHGFTILNRNNTTFTVSTPYNADFNAAIKTYGGRYYNRSWHLPRSAKPAVLRLIDDTFGTDYVEQYEQWEEKKVSGEKASFEALVARAEAKRVAREAANARSRERYAAKRAAAKAEAEVKGQG